MTISKRTREIIAFVLAGTAIILRMLSDWIFPNGGPLNYQFLQAFLLFIALIFIWKHLEIVFLRGGNMRSAIRIGLLGIPLGFLFGLGGAWLEYGKPQWGSLSQIFFMVLNNLFFSAVEELEFRGFLMSWLRRRNISPILVIMIVTLIAALVHWHRFLQGDVRSIIITIAVNAWWTWLVYRTKSLWGGWIAHATWNIFVLLPS